jgi:hypothetical protein
MSMLLRVLLARVHKSLRFLLSLKMQEVTISVIHYFDIGGGSTTSEKGASIDSKSM